MNKVNNKSEHTCKKIHFDITLSLASCNMFEFNTK